MIRSCRRPLLAVLGGLALVASSVSVAQARSTAEHRPVTRVHPAQHRPGQPDLGPNVYVFTPDMPQAQIQSTVDAIATQQVPNQFGAQRYSLLFAPGTYGSAADPLNFQVGYYTEVAGLGALPTDVTINGSVNVYNQCTGTGAATSCLALNNFWRSLSNLSIDLPASTSCASSADFWAVSQAAPMRRVNITGGNVSLQDYCTAGPQFASGGYIADSSFSGGTVINGSQQQFIVRNSSLDGWTNGVWNQVFAGDLGAPAQSFSETSGLPGGTQPYTTLPTSPVTQEKPLLYLDAGGAYRVFVPAVRHDSVGTSWDNGTSLPLDRFYLARPSDSAERINSQLARGKNLLLTPGVYHLQRPLQVRRAATIVLGMGFATLVPQHGDAALQVENAPGAKISGLIVDAGPRNSRVLVQLDGGDGRSDGRHSGEHGRTGDPTSLQDVFFRIGGATAGRASTALVVNSNNTVLDDIWAWRADHGAGVGWTQNTADTGVVINGDDVTAYGLFVEHFQKTEVVWNGERGTDIFFQNEMPYDPPSQAAWNASRTFLGYPAFVVGRRVKTFTGYGMGSYSFFNQGVDIHASTAFVVPVRPGVQLHDILTRFLDGSGGIDHVVNDTGGPVTSATPGPSDVVSYP